VYYLFLFCLFFLVFPVAIAAVVRIVQLVRGPGDDSLYSQQMYRELLKQALPELIFCFIILIGAIIVLFWGVSLPR